MLGRNISLPCDPKIWLITRIGYNVDRMMSFHQFAGFNWKTINIANNGVQTIINRFAGVPSSLIYTKIRL
jgi:hypothetical protein